ncbi:Hachiman antiphage defense system protein HamA, partial [Listeria newyorkensis]
KNLDRYSSKIRLKYFTWKELISNNEILFKKISDIIFNKDNVIKLASTYNPDLTYSQALITKKYFSALQNIGFISEDGININHTVLHGDIGEFLMHTLVSEFIESIGDKYIYPKLIFKTSPSMAVYGNDGSIYIPEKKEIYYLEAKFYSSLNQAINKAVDSLEKHNDDLHEDMNYSAELFRNIKTNRTNELVEITDDVTEKLIIFLICDDIYKEDEVKNMIEKNSNFLELKEKFETLVFVLPILDKNDFLEFFQAQSMLEGKEYYE